MGIFLGDKPVNVFFNGANASLPVQGVFLGGIQVFPAGTAATPAALLLNFNGENNSTTFTDSSAAGLTVTANGDAQISTSQSKFGGASGLFDGDGDYLSLSLTPDYSGDFTIEMWFRRAGGGAANTLFAAGEIEGGVGGLHLSYDSSGELLWNDALTATIAGGTATLNEWVHIAAVRSGGTNTLYVNGFSVGTSEQTFPVGNSVVEIGGTPRYGFYADGYIDDLRVVFGKAVYTANFTPPAAQLGPDV